MKMLLTSVLLSVAFLAKAQEKDEQIIRSNIKAFSEALMAGDTISIANSYTKDGKILPNGSMILEGQSLKDYWNRGIRNGLIYFHHKVTPEEIKILGDHAYDFGYYEGESGKGENRSKWKGKYVILWKKVDNKWKMYLDIWNGINDN